MTEAVLRANMRDKLREHALVIPYPQDGRGRRGTPDIYVASLPFAGWIELKTQDYETSEIQKSVIRSINARGSRAHVLRKRGRIYTLEDECGGVHGELPPPGLPMLLEIGRLSNEVLQDRP